MPSAAQRRSPARKGHAGPTPTVLALAVAGALCSGAHAQIVTDGSLGAASTLSGPNFSIPATLGRQAGANLFHSFAAFNVPTGGSAIFSGPASVGNVLARVTGGNASNINGRLGTSIAGANLFLINPSGILFGSGATLDLTGSFHATTANYIRMSDGTRFEAVAVDPGVLSVAAPQAFGFLGPTPAPITITSSVLNGAFGRDVSYVGGNVTISGSAARVRGRGGDLRIASASGAGEFALDTSLTPTPGMTQGTITVSGGAQLNAESVTSPALAPGRIVIRGGQIAIAGASITSVNSQAADARPIEITSTGVSDGTINGAGFVARGATIVSRSNAGGRGADVVINAPAMQFDQFTRVQTIAGSTGRGGDLRFTAAGTLTVLAQQADPNFTAITSFALAGGRGGDVTLRGDRVVVDAGIVQVDGRGAGAGGAITLDAGEVSVVNGGFIFNYMRNTSSGAGGNVLLNASRRIDLSGSDWGGNVSTVLADTWGSGRGGNVTFSAPEIAIGAGAEYGTRAVSSGRGGNLSLNGQQIVLTDALGYAYSYSTGAAGDITVTGPRITFAGGGIISVAYDRGNAGAIRLTGDTIRLQPGILNRDVNIESSNSQSTGDGGNVEIRATTSFTIDTTADRRSFARVAAVTQGGGRGGSILIDAPSVLLDGGALFSRTRWGTGQQGQILVRADSLRMAHDGRIISTTEGPRDGSLIDISARSIVMQDGAVIVASADRDLSGFSPTTTGSAGRISITGEALRMTGASRIEVNANDGTTGNAGALTINLTGAFEMVERAPAFGVGFSGADPLWPGGLSSQARGSGNAGSIGVTAASIVLDDARIQSNALLNGRGGSVTLRAGDIELRNGAQVDARSAIGSTGAAGSIDIAATGALRIGGRSPTDGAFSGLYAETQGSGTGGSITLAADALTIDRGIVRTSTTGGGNAGPLTVRAGELHVVNGGWIDAGTSAGSSGAGGRVDIAATRALTVSGIDTTPVVTDVIAPDLVRGVAGRAQGPFPSTISSNTAGAGAGGNLLIDAPTITIDSGGRISATASASGNAGSIALSAADALYLYGGTISTQALASDGGNIDIRVGEMLRLKGGEISTAVGGGSGAGGNISIDPIFVVFEQGSSIVANAFGGPGGNIGIVANYFFSAADTVIDASSALGVPGVVQIATPNVDVAGRLATLPAQFLDRSGLLRSACAVRGGAPASSLVAVGRGGLPASPEHGAVGAYFDAPGPAAPVAARPAAMHLAAAAVLPRTDCR
jgi:filamentous hemagglutinin family protein